jgi:hypothetical protein
MHMLFNLHDKKFRALSNSANGEVSADTVFHYQQEGIFVWAEYSGGDIVKGQLVGTVVNGRQLEFVYQHINKALQVMTGKCISYPVYDSAGKITLYEKWQWTCNDHSTGESVLVEI